MKTPLLRRLSLCAGIAFVVATLGDLAAEPERTLHPNGKVHEVIPRVDGWIQGVYLEYNDSGQLLREIPHKDNRWHGTAKFYHANGKLREETEYLLGVKHGMRRTFHENGEKHEEMSYKKDWLEGLYREWAENGRLQREVPHKDNEWHGEVKFYHPNGELSEVNTRTNGRLDGPRRTYFVSGAVKEEMTYKDGWVQGLYREFDEFGELMREVPHKDNEWHGQVKFYHPNGQLSEEHSRVTGELDGMKRTYFLNGTLREEVPYQKGWVQGLYREWDEAGRIKREVPHKDNEWHGVVKFYHPNGNISEQHTRVNGEFDGLKHTFFSDGAMREEVPYKEGWVQGLYREWNESGVLAREIPHRDNKWHGIARHFHSNGQLSEETPYWMGNRHGTSRKFDRDGKLVSSTEHVAPEAPADAAGQIAAATPPSTAGRPPPTAPAADSADRAPAAPPAGGSGPAIASSTDPETGITTTSARQPDGSRVVTQTDADGNVISSTVFPPAGSEPAFASSFDPKTGVMTTATEGADGERVVTTTEKVSADGVDKIVETDNRGNRTETVLNPDGTTGTITEKDANGNTRTITRNPDGGFKVVENTVDGYVTETTNDGEGGTVTVRRDLDGSPMETITRNADGREVREDAIGNKVETTTSADGLVTEVSTDRRGNTTTVVSDMSGNEVSRTENRVAPREPGQEYFETVLGGDDWENVPQSLRTGYAASEQEIRNNAARQALREEQEADRLRVDAEMKADSEARSRETEGKLAAIRAEEEAAQAAIARREAREARERAIEESHEKAKELQRQYDAAIARGDKKEAARLMAEQDRHHDESMDLLAFTEEEQAEADRKQDMRNKLFDEIVGNARAVAQTKVDQDWEQDLKETVTAGTQYVSVGSQMQQETKESTRRANYELAFAEAKKERIEKRLQDPDLSAEERDILNDMLDLAAVQAQGASTQLASNANLTTAGYAIDVGMLASGGLANAGVALGAKATARVAGEKAAEKFVSVVAERGIADLGKSGVMAATERLAGRETAEALATKAAAAREVVTAAGERLSQAGSNAATRIVGEETLEKVGAAATKVSNVLSTDVATGAVGESTLIRAAVEDMAVGTTVDTGMQVATTGTVDIKEVVKGAVVGGVVAGGTAAFPGGPRPTGGADASPRPPSAAPGSAAPAPSSPPVSAAASPPARTGTGITSAVDNVPTTSPSASPAPGAPTTRVEPPRVDPASARSEAPALAERPRASAVPAETPRASSSAPREAPPPPRVAESQPRSPTPEPASNVPTPRREPPATAASSASPAPNPSASRPVEIAGTPAPTRPTSAPEFRSSSTPDTPAVSTPRRNPPEVEGTATTAAREPPAPASPAPSVAPARRPAPEVANPSPAPGRVPESRPVGIARTPVDRTPAQPARLPDPPATPDLPGPKIDSAPSGPPLPRPTPVPAHPEPLPTTPPIIGGMREHGIPVVQPALTGGSAPPVPRPDFYDSYSKPGSGGQPSLRDQALSGNPRNSADARAALARILDSDGVPSWPEMAKTIDAQDPQIRDQLLEMRGWVWDQLTARYDTKIKATGSSGKFSNDLDFSNITDAPGGQMLEIDNFLANEIDLGNGVRGFGPDWRQKLNMDTFLDPQLIHIYDKVGDSAARAGILHDPDLFRKGDLIALEQMHHNMSPAAFEDFLRTTLPEHPGLNHSNFGEFLDANLGTPSTRQELLPRLDEALGKFNRTGDPAAARDIVDLQMQLNRITPDAYPSPGAVKNILTINEGMFDIPPGTKFEPPSGRSIEDLNGGRTPTEAGEIKRLAKKLEGDPANAADAAYLKEKFSELQSGVPVDPVERYQNAVNNIAYFEHQVHEAGGNPLVALQRYQTSKYESRVLSNVRGLSGDGPPPGGLVDQIDDAVNRFYKERGPEIERYFGREGQTMSPTDRARLENEAGEFLEVLRSGNNALARRARKEAMDAVHPGSSTFPLDGSAPVVPPPGGGSAGVRPPDVPASAPVPRTPGDAPASSGLRPGDPHPRAPSPEAVGDARKWADDLAGSNPKRMTDEEIASELAGFVERRRDVESRFEAAKADPGNPQKLPPGVSFEQLELAVKGDSATGQRVPLNFSVESGTLVPDVATAKKNFAEFQDDVRAVFERHGIDDAVVVQLGSGTTGWSTSPKKKGKSWSPQSDVDFAIFSDQALVQARKIGAPINPDNSAGGRYTTLKNNVDGGGGFYDTPLGRDLKELSRKWDRRIYGEDAVADGFDFKLNLDSDKPFKTAVPVLQAGKPQVLPVEAGASPGTTRATTTAGREGSYTAVTVKDPRFVLPPDVPGRREYHITVVSPPEMASLSPEMRARVASGVDIAGIPKAGKVLKKEFEGAPNYQLEVDWPEAAALRESLGLPQKDLHVSLNGGLGDAARARELPDLDSIVPDEQP